MSSDPTKRPVGSLAVVGDASEVVDVVVLGFGAAGAAAAITVHDLGGTALILEKAEVGGGSTQASGGNIRTIRDPGKAVAHFARIADQGTPIESLSAMVQGMLLLPEWLKGLGAEFAVNAVAGGLATIAPNQALGVIPQGSAFSEKGEPDPVGPRMQVAGEKHQSGGERLWAVLEKSVIDRGIRVEYKISVDRLVRDNDGRISGVEIRVGDSFRRILARGGVVLACGGFNWSPEMHIDLFGTRLYALTPPHRNEGDGIRLAQDVGAQLWHMTAIAARYGYKFPEYEAAFKCTPPSQGIFLVDQLGRRYVDEAGVPIHSAGLCMLDRDPKTGRLLRCPSHLVFDETTRLSGPIGPQPNGHNRTYTWSHDNSAEIERGWIVRADTLGELAKLIGVPPDTLGETTRRFNAACLSDDDEYGRAASNMEQVITPPFYSVPVWPVLLNTQGGPKRNERSEVLDTRNNPIPGLFSAGELGSLWGRLYPGAGNVAEALVSGQAAAANALAVRWAESENNM